MLSIDVLNLLAYASNSSNAGTSTSGNVVQSVVA